MHLKLWRHPRTQWTYGIYIYGPPADPYVTVRSGNNRVVDVVPFLLSRARMMLKSNREASRSRDLDVRLGRLPNSRGANEPRLFWGS